jgi:hypothetical protein
MTNPWDRPPLPTKGDEKEDVTYAAVGRALSHWENIEVELSHLFALYINKMWTNEGYDRYYQDGKTTRGRLDALRIAAENYFVGRPNQEAEGSFSRLMEAATGFADRRHEVAHGIVRPINWYWPILRPNHFAPDAAFQFCLVPPHYQRGWITDGAPNYIYTSDELDTLTLRLFSFLHDLMDFRFRYLPSRIRPADA